MNINTHTHKNPQFCAKCGKQLERYANTKGKRFCKAEPCQKAKGKHVAIKKLEHKIVFFDDPKWVGWCKEFHSLRTPESE